MSGAFSEEDWRGPDYTAIVGFGGLLSVGEPGHAACRDWLLGQEYAIDTFDCRPGLAVAVPELGRLLRWEEQFGYAMNAERRSLDALRDGFDFDIPEGGGRVFEIVRPDLAWEEDRRWLGGLLAIVQEHSREQLALGRRFFALLVVPEQSPFIGAVFEEERVPHPWWGGFPGERGHGVAGD